nr:PREDICTED: LRR receptor-like serine/threonine-protein kinase GSO1 [Musa acuminata subsp. malaccensis]
MSWGFPVVMCLYIPTETSSPTSHLHISSLLSAQSMTAAGSGSFQDGRIASKRLMMLVALLLVSCCLGHGFGDEDHGEVEGIGSSCMESERRALLAIKSDMYDPDNWFSSWTGKDCCGWRGVACDHTTGHVTKLDLRYPYTYELWDMFNDGERIGVSKVNPSLQELKQLKYLDLSMNNFSHAPVPKMIASLVHLEYLNLSYAMFDGPIPPQLGNLSNLHYLDLQRWYDDDFLHVDDLDWLSRIPSLKYLDMSYVNLSKATNWFYIINSIPTLEVLHLFDVDLPYVPSPLPPFNLTDIATLDLSLNSNIRSAMLRWLSNATSLENLLLSGCGSLTIESVQAALGALSNLKGLDLSDNLFKGEIREILNNVSSRGLKHLDLSSNQLSGDIPPGSLRDLEYLDLSLNLIVDVHILASLGNLTNLRHLWLSGNSISGEIPPIVGDSVRLEYLDLSFNGIIGKIPQSIGNLTNLEQNFLIGFRLNSDCKGFIYLELGSQVLDLSSNNLTGSLPSSLANFSAMVEMHTRSFHEDCPVYRTPPDARVKHEDDEKLDKLLECTSIVVGFWLFIGTLIMKQAIRFAFFRWIDKTSDWIYVQFAVNLAKLKSKWQTMT